MTSIIGNELLKRIRQAGPAAAALLALLLLAACAIEPAAEPAAQPRLERPLFTLPYSVDEGGRPTVPVTLNGGYEATFIVDTAATNSAVFRPVATRLDLPRPDGERRVFAINGAETRPLARLQSLEVGGFRREQIDVVVLASQSDGGVSIGGAPDGVLGLDVLSDFLIMFDRETSTLRFYAPRNPPTSIVSAWDSASMYADTFGFATAPLYRLDATLGRRTVTVVLDTGSSITFGNRAFLREVPTLPQIRPSRTPSRLNDANDEESEIRLLTVARLRVDEIDWRHRPVIIVDAQVFTDFGYQERALAFLGFDILGRRSFAIDFNNLVFYVDPTPLEEETQ